MSTDLLQELERAALIEDGDRGFISVSHVASKIFRADPALAFECLAPYFAAERLRQPGGVAIADAVLRLFLPDFLRYSKGQSVPEWRRNPEAPLWFRQDPRWMELCVRLRRDEQLGGRARDVLRFADPAAVKAALAVAREREGSRVIPWRSQGPGDLVTRYRRGEHEAVWNELRRHEAIVGALREEALAVARETMQRVAGCCDLVAERLAGHGWRSLSS